MQRHVVSGQTTCSTGDHSDRQLPAGSGAVSGMTHAGRHCRMAYLSPTTDEIRHLVAKFWQEDLDPSKRARADDAGFLNLKVQLTQQMMARLIRSGLAPVEAERRAIREVALVD
jgi:hypothetical protein